MTCAPRTRDVGDRGWPARWRASNLARVSEARDGDRVEFDAVIGVEVKGEVWNCVEIPASAAFFGTGRAVRVDARVDDVVLENVGAMVTGTGGHMVSLSAKVRKRLGKEVGDAVHVTVTKRV